MGALQLLLFILFSYVSAINIPTYIKPCGINDSGFETCAKSVTKDILEHFEQGDAAFQVPPLSAFRLPVLTFVNDKFLVNETDPVVYGLENLKLTQIKKIPHQNKIIAVLSAGKVHMVGNVFIDAVIHGRHILGGGFSNKTLIDLNYSYNFTWTPFKKGDHTYVQILKQEVDWIPRQVNFNISFVGVDEKTGKQMNQHLNENWEEVIQKLQPSSKYYLQILFNTYTNPFFSKVPYDHLFLD